MALFTGCDAGDSVGTHLTLQSCAESTLPCIQSRDRLEVLA
jgi:hypothetical protein